MNEHVGVAVSEQSESVVYLYSSEPEVSSGYQSVHIEAESHTYFHVLILVPLI